MSSSTTAVRQARRASYPARRLRRCSGILVLVAAGAACHTAPVTGRHALNLFSAADDVQLGAQAYQQVLSEAEVVTSGPELAMVQRTMARLVAVADDPGYDWEVSLLREDSTVNAFALPGGKMAVYTGILPVCRDETGLAVVMGHEIGHVVARHGTERMTSAVGADILLSYLGSQDYVALAQLGFEFVFARPFGRKHESEADEIGLIYMARAGYDPREAVAFWQRMSQATGGGPPEFLSTHPSHETRVERLRAKLPEALEIYNASAAGSAR